MSVGIAAALVLAAAQPPSPAPPAPALAAAPKAITSYPPEFFVAAQPTTALDMVVLLPGFTFDRGDAVRGFGGAAGNVLIDGARPASKDDGLDQVLSRVPARSVLRIDVIRGAAPGIDMQGKTVLANVIRRGDAGAKLTLAASATRAYDGRLGGALDIEASKRSGQTSYEGSLLVGQGFDDGAGDGPRTRADAAGNILFTAAEVQKAVGQNYKVTGAVETPALGGKLRINGSISLNPYDSTTADALTPPPGAELDHYRENKDTAELGARFERALGPRTNLEVFVLQQLSRDPVNDDFTADAAATAATGDDSSDIFAERKTSSESIARASVKFDSSRTLSFQTGGEGDFNWERYQTTFIQNGATVVLPAANVQVTEARAEVFGTATWQAHPTLTLEAGLRTEASRIAASGDVVSGRTLIFPKPRAVVTWSPDPADQIRLRVEGEVGQLNFDDFGAQSGSLNTGTVRAGNPNLNPQRDWVVEAAYERHFWGAGDATVTLRHYQLTDVIDRVPVQDSSGAFFDAPGNIGSGTKDEVAFTLTLPTDRLGLKRGLLTGQATLRRSSVIDPTIELARPISGLHPNDWEVHFTQGLPRWKSTWGFDIFGQWRETYYRFDEIDTDKLKTFVVLYAEYKPRPDLAFRVELRNAGGRGFEHTRQVYLGPRNVDGLDYTDVRDLHVGRFVYFRVLKTFG
ncbi:MAG: outer membrane beta-barrel protein [Pseudomonadota bacterium]|nr:outer membrane beta-barrel protein [Pseudomonadota bacterium]